MEKKIKQFKKFDTGKLNWSLLPLDSIKAIIRVLMLGADKYGSDNWCKGADWSRYYNALIRHITAWWQGDNLDMESKYSHLWHAGCCILFLIAYEIRHIGKDDRPKIKHNLSTFSTATAYKPLPDNIIQNMNTIIRK